MGKTHWLQSQNKNYLGHFDLPDGKDVVLTIESAKWEEVVNLSIHSSEMRRVIRFKEKHNWIKPFICNETNAKAILKSTQEKYMEDSVGKLIKLSVSMTKLKGEYVDCIRVKNVPQSELIKAPISINQLKEIRSILEEIDSKNEDDICKAMSIEGLEELQEHKYKPLMDRLKEIRKEEASKNEGN